MSVKVQVHLVEVSSWVQTEKTVTFFSLISVTYGQKKKKNRAKNPALTEEMRTGLNMFTLQLQLFFNKSKKF